jgi:hypothetical protein
MPIGVTLSGLGLFVAAAITGLIGRERRMDRRRGR